MGKADNMRRGIKLIAALGIAATILSCSTGCSQETMDALRGLANTINDELGQLGEAATAAEAYLELKDLYLNADTEPTKQYYDAESGRIFEEYYMEMGIPDCYKVTENIVVSRDVTTADDELVGITHKDDEPASTNEAVDPLTLPLKQERVDTTLTLYDKTDLAKFHRLTNNAYANAMLTEVEVTDTAENAKAQYDVKSSATTNDPTMLGSVDGKTGYELRELIKKSSDGVKDSYSSLYRQEMENTTSELTD